MSFDPALSRGSALTSYAVTAIDVANTASGDQTATRTRSTERAESRSLLAFSWPAPLRLPASRNPSTPVSRSGRRLLAVMPLPWASRDAVLLPQRPTRETRPPTPASASGRPPHGVEPAPSSGPRAERLVASSRQPAPAGPASLRTGSSFSISTSWVESSCRSGRSSSPDRPTPTATATNAAAATEAARHAATCWRSGIEAPLPRAVECGSYRRRSLPGSDRAAVAYPAPSGTRLAHLPY